MSDKPSISVNVLQPILDKRHVEVAYNELIHRIEIYDHDGILFDSETPFDSLIAYIGDQYRDVLSHCDKEHISQTLTLIADRNKRNPVFESILKTDINNEDDYISEICNDILRISPSDKLSNILLRKAILQAVALLLNDSKNPYGADGILVFIGSQGIGKSLAVECFALDSKYYRAISFNAYSDEADLLSKANGVFIAEFSELERTLKPNTMEIFKAFITAGKDSYRPKYGRTVNDYVRRSTFMATCNTDGFLYDRTGNRRFWTIPCENKFNIDRLIACKNGEDDIFRKAYKQAYLFLQENGFQSFRLTEQERSLLEERNNKYMYFSDIENILKTILICSGLTEFTIAQLKDTYIELQPFDNVLIGRSLKKLQLPQAVRKIDKDGRSSTERYYTNTLLDE